MSDSPHGSGLRWLIQTCNPQGGIKYWIEKNFFVSEPTDATIMAEKPKEELLAGLREINKDCSIESVVFFYTPVLSMSIPRGWRPLDMSKAVQRKAPDAPGIPLHPLMIE